LDVRKISVIVKKMQKNKDRLGENEMKHKLSDGFYDILTMITEEVITHKPLNLYRFCANVLEQELDRQILSELVTGK